MAIEITNSPRTKDASQINSNHSNMRSSKISQLAEPIFKKIKELSSKHLRSPTYLLVNQEDMVAKKILKVSSWIFGISPTILLGAYVYDHLSNLYRQHFQNYSRMEEYPDEISENLESPAQLPKDQPAKIESLPEHTIPAILEPNISVTEERDTDDDISDTTAETDLGNDLDKDSFEQVNMTPALLEEMKNSPGMPSHSGNRIIEVWKGIKAFLANNPFTSQKPNVTSITIPSESKSKEPSYKDFEMLNPITIDHTDTKIDTTAFSIQQIKIDLDRMNIVVNGKRCLNIQDFMNELGLTLNKDETDILADDNLIISKILHFSHQGFLSSSLRAFQTHVMQYPDKYAAQITGRKDKPLSIHINWNAQFPEQSEVTGEISFHVKSMVDGSILPYAYTVKTCCSLEKEEITWVALEEAEQPETMIETPATEGSDDEDFETLEGTSEDISNVNYNWNIAFNHLLNKPDTCLNSTVTSEYLKSLKTKHSTFVYEDRLMLPGSITTDELTNLLNKLKQENPTNQTIFLPFLVKGWTVDHAVVAVINLADETIEYFDPKGQSSILPTRAEKQSNKNVFDFLTDLGQKVISSTFSKEKIVYNKKNVPQGFFDDINCGAFCLQFIEERITRPFNDIENDSAVDPKELRRRLAHRLVENTHSNSI